MRKLFLLCITTAKVLDSVLLKQEKVKITIKCRFRSYKNNTHHQLSLIPTVHTAMLHCQSRPQYRDDPNTSGKSRDVTTQKA